MWRFHFAISDRNAIFDGRNLYDPAMVRAQGLEYYPIGRKA